MYKTERNTFLNNTYYSLKTKTVMKTNKLFGLAVLACGFAMSFTSCSNDDNPVAGGLKVYNISFENQTLNTDGYWCGDETGEKFDNWGEVGYECTYTENDLTITANYTPSWYSWSGFAISNRTETTFKNLTPDQFNSIAGKAHTGNNYCVVYPFAEDIVVNGFWYTNEAWTVDAILNGDGMTPGKFEADDWFKCTVYGEKENGEIKTVEFYLAKDGDYVKDWQFCDLSSMGKVVSLSFVFDSTKKNSWGPTTPTYMCIDDIQVEK